MLKIKHLLYRLLKAGPSGLKKRKPKVKDYRTSELGWGKYIPQHAEHIIPTISIKDQKSSLTCQWQATTIQKEIDEKVILAARSLVIKGKEMGLVGNLGLSDLEGGQKVLLKWGILTEDSCSTGNINDWSEYVTLDVNKHSEEAAKHKIKSYWFVDSLDDIYRLLDQGRILTTGTRWYTGFNQTGGFKWPWIIEKIIGWFVGGHAFAVIGYDREYQGKPVLVIQNSYGNLWGHSGRFYITESHFINECLNRYGCITNLDADTVEDADVIAGKSIFERVKGHYVFIMRPESKGEMYEINDNGIIFVPIYIGSEVMKNEFNEYLRTNKKFIGVSELDFSRMSKYAKIQGLKVGEKILIDHIVDKALNK